MDKSKSHKKNDFGGQSQLNQKREFWINPNCKKVRLWDKSKTLQRNDSGIDMSCIMMCYSQHLEKGDFRINPIYCKNEILGLV